MRHEIVDFYSAVLAMRIRVQGSKQCGTALNAHANMQRPALISVFPPAQEFRITQIFLRLGDGAAAYPIQDKLMPELV